MKYIVRIFPVILFVFFSVVCTTSVCAQGAPPPPPEGGHGAAGNQTTNGSAPIGSGLFVLLGLGAAYGATKVRGFKHEKLEE